LTVAAAAAMTGVDLAKIARLPNTRGLSNEIVLPLAHDINFGAPISQMIRLSGARVVRIGTAGHCGAFHLEGAIGERTAAVFYVDSGDVNPAGSFLSLERSIEAAHAKAVPVVVDCAAAGDVRPFLEAGADLVLTSAHKQMGAPTCGMICGRLDLVRACYLQNYGIGRAMKVGKEGVAGCMAAVEAWYSRDSEAQLAGWRNLAAILAAWLPIREGPSDWVVVCPVPPEKISARALANNLREADPPVWVRSADDAAGELHLDLRVMSESDAVAIAERISSELDNPSPPIEDAPYHDLYWSERRLLEWPSWR
jgi:L-seryl-tRNA(Ser) seleniumtransferase